MTQLLVHASGFKNPFSDDSAELSRFQMLANRFAQNARITLLGCNSGGLPETGGRRLVDFVSCATLLPVHGYFHMIDSVSVTENTLNI
jgi:hypothetical protein